MLLQRIQNKWAKVCKCKKVPMQHLCKCNHDAKGVGDSPAHHQTGANGSTNN